MDIQVSIICNAYNHEQYIRETLQGFIIQKTTFPFEVLIHDDASTDKTATIIREYEKKYPEIIKPIYQKENQYSKSISITRDIQLPRANGRFIAICEGDDCWTDSNKLQIQYEALVEHTSIDMCAHAAEEVDGVSGTHIRWIKPKDHDCILNLKQVIKGGGNYLATASLFYRKELDLNPPSFRKAYSLDYALQVAGALKGGIYYYAKPMSLYRSMTPGSWTRQLRIDESKKIAHKRKMRTVLTLMDKETKYKYHLYFVIYKIDNYIRTAILRMISMLHARTK